MTDDQDQADEILALQSIYDDSLVCDIDKKPYTGVVIPLKYLSPLTLDYFLPENYPSTCIPQFNLSCFWLSSHQLEVLSKELVSLWEANQGYVVLFMWAEFLQADAFSVLNLKFPLVISQKKLFTLTDHSRLREKKEFESTIQECPICFCEKSGVYCVKLAECGHIFCNSCMSDYLEVHIKDGNIKSYTCLEGKCGTEIHPGIIKNLVKPDLFERYDRLLLKTSLDLMSDVSYCPRRNCGSPVIIDKSENLGMCQACSFSFCTYCKSVYHGIEKCRFKSEEYQEIIEAYSNGTRAQKEQMEKLYGKQQLTEIVENFASENWIKNNSKKCPKCSANIEKSDGCNKMICTKCKSYFCWLCSDLIKERNPYDHFSKTSSKCYNKLFPVVPNDIDVDDNDD